MADARGSTFTQLAGIAFILDPPMGHELESAR